MYVCLSFHLNYAVALFQQVSHLSTYCIHATIFYYIFRHRDGRMDRKFERQSLTETNRQTVGRHRHRHSLYDEDTETGTGGHKQTQSQTGRDRRRQAGKAHTGHTHTHTHTHTHAHTQ